MSEDADHADKVYHEGVPVSDYSTKQALLVAGHKDTLEIEGHGEMTVLKRTDPYFGPKMRLADETGHNHLLVPHGFAHDPVLWRAEVDDDNFINGWERVGEVSCEVVDVAPSKQCECGEVLQDLKEKRMAVVGVCPHE